MELIPAIDLHRGRVVRLRKGRYDDVTVYADDPVEPARRFHAAGARSLHVVDLDGARDGVPGNVEVVRRILGAVDLDVQVGGGVRDPRSAGRWLEAGARVVLGTVVVKDPAFAQALCREHPGRVVLAIDARAGEVAVEGWLERSGRDALELAREVDAWAPSALLFTNIDRDGTSEGPDVEGTARLQRAVGTRVIASGGIGSLDDLIALSRAGIRAAVCGRALYDDVFTYAEAVGAIEEAT
jgi:phosphoribosylformimino-5-aminoimidazole carboxamide ribotide isomerase